MRRPTRFVFGIVITAVICLALVVGGAVYDELSVLRRVF